MNTTQTSSWRTVGIVLIAVGAGGYIGHHFASTPTQPAATERAPAQPAPSLTQNTATKPALTVQTVMPSTTKMPIGLYANGNIAAWQEAVMGTEVSGLALQEVRVNVGDQVKKGQVLARLNDSTLQADVAQAQANLAEAQATLLEAESNANRARSVRNTGALSQQQIDQYINAETTAKARLQAMQSALHAQQIRLKQTTLIAPDSGLISKREATVGQVVSAGQELFRLIRQGKIEWRGEFNARDLAKLKVGMPVELTLPDNTQTIGKVRALAPTTDTATRNTLVYVDIPSHAANPGMFAKGKVSIGDYSATTLPYSAIVMRDGFNFVMHVDAQHRVHAQKVELGQRQGSVVEVQNLPDTHAQFVLSGGAFLADGDWVKVVN